MSVSNTTQTETTAASLLPVVSPTWVPPTTSSRVGSPVQSTDVKDTNSLTRRSKRKRKPTTLFKYIGRVAKQQPSMALSEASTSWINNMLLHFLSQWIARSQFILFGLNSSSLSVKVAQQALNGCLPAAIASSLVKPVTSTASTASTASASTASTQTAATDATATGTAVSAPVPDPNVFSTGMVRRCVKTIVTLSTIHISDRAISYMTRVLETVTKTLLALTASTASVVTSPTLVQQLANLSLDQKEPIVRIEPIHLRRAILQHWGTWYRMGTIGPLPTPVAPVKVISTRKSTRTTDAAVTDTTDAVGVTGAGATGAAHDVPKRTIVSHNEAVVLSPIWSPSTVRRASSQEPVKRVKTQTEPQKQ